MEEIGRWRRKNPHIWILPISPFSITPWVWASPRYDTLPFRLIHFSQKILCERSCIVSLLNPCWIPVNCCWFLLVPVITDEDSFDARYRFRHLPDVEIQTKHFRGLWAKVRTSPRTSLTHHKPGHKQTLKSIKPPLTTLAKDLWVTNSIFITGNSPNAKFRPGYTCPKVWA